MYSLFSVSDIILRHILQNMESKIFLSNGSVFVPDVCQHRLFTCQFLFFHQLIANLPQNATKNDVGTREIFFADIAMYAKKPKNAKKNPKCQNTQKCQKT